MRVLLSIRPEFAFRIFDGSKKFEFRRTIFKRDDITGVVVYATDPIKQVIGEFEIGDILCDEPQELWEQTKNNAGISEKKFLEYFTNKSKGYAISVKSARIYDDPLPLKYFMVSSPPQSFTYVL